MSQPINETRIRQIFFLIILIILGSVLFFQLKSFLPALLGAITLYLLLRKWMIVLIDKHKWKPWSASLFLIFISFLVILVPVYLIVNMLSGKVIYAVEHSTEFVAALQKLITKLEQQYNFKLIGSKYISDLGVYLAKSIPNILNATFSSITMIVFMYFILYFMLVHTKKMEKAMYEYIPLKIENIRLLAKEVNTMVLSNAIGIPVIAIAQGLLGLIIYLVVGVGDPWFWFGFTCISAVLPIVGSALAYVPLGLILLANDQQWQGFTVLIYGFLVIGSADNLLRFSLLKKIGNVHPLITFFGVFAGISLFGFLGLIFGPLLISLFILLLKIYSNEFIVKQRSLFDSMDN